MNDKSTLIYIHSYNPILNLGLIYNKYHMIIICKSDVINVSERKIHYQLYNRFKIKLDQKGIRFNAYKLV